MILAALLLIAVGSVALGVSYALGRDNRRRLPTLSEREAALRLRPAHNPNLSFYPAKAPIDRNGRE